jgi:hypothetical protein
MRKQANQDVAKAMSSQVVTAAKRSDLIFHWYQLISAGVASPVFGKSSTLAISVSWRMLECSVSQLIFLTYNDCDS